MHPVLFEIPGIGFPLPAFGAMVAAGTLLGLWLWGRILSRFGDDPKADPIRAADVALWLVIGTFGGARLMYVGVETSRYLSAEVTPGMADYLESGRRLPDLTEDERDRADEIAVGYDFVRDPFQILFFWKGGLVMYGGLIGALLLGTWSSRRRGLDPWNALDTGLVAGFVGQAVGRWGCLFVGDDYGSVAPAAYRHLPFPITYRVPPLEWLQANPRSLFPNDLAGEVIWATQPWMSLNALMIAGVAWMILRRRSFRGQVLGWVLIHYSITRFVIEMFRGDEIRGIWFGGAISTSQLFSIPGVLLGAWILWRRSATRRAAVATP